MSLCLASCVLTITAKPHHIIPLFILCAGSFGIHSSVLTMIVIHKISR